MRYTDIMQRRITTPAGLGRATRDARKRRGWSQTTLAEHAGVTQATVSNFERGEGNPTFATVLALASASGLRLLAELGEAPGGAFPWESEDGAKPSGDPSGQR